MLKCQLLKQVAKDALGEGSLEFAKFLHKVAKQLLHEEKMKRANALLRHSLSIFEVSTHPNLPRNLGQIGVLSSIAACSLLNMKLENAHQTAGQALLLCKTFLWPHTSGESTDYHLHHLWTVERLLATHSSPNLLAAIRTSKPAGNAKLEACIARRISLAAAEAFTVHSRAVSPVNLQLGMNSAANAVLCCHFATAGQGVQGILAWCQVCACATMRLLQKHGHRWCLLVPWGPQPFLSHHALLHSVHHHDALEIGFVTFMRDILSKEVGYDVGPPHDESEAILLQLFKEVPCKGVEALSVAAVRVLFKRCLRKLAKHRQTHIDSFMQLTLLFAYLLVLEVRLLILSCDSVIDRRLPPAYRDIRKWHMLRCVSRHVYLQPVL
jgi:hypothetical protein